MLLVCCLFFASYLLFKVELFLTLLNAFFFFAKSTVSGTALYKI
jgi:hypothetical protein